MSSKLLYCGGNRGGVCKLSGRREIDFDVSEAEVEAQGFHCAEGVSGEEFVELAGVVSWESDEAAAVSEALDNGSLVLRE